MTTLKSILPGVNAAAVLLVLCVLLFADYGDAKVPGKRRVKHGAVQDEPTLADKLWIYVKILIGVPLAALELSFFDVPVIRARVFRLRRYEPHIRDFPVCLLHQRHYEGRGGEAQEERRRFIWQRFFQQPPRIHAR